MQPLLVRVEAEEPVEKELQLRAPPQEVVLRPTGEITELIKMGVALQTLATARHIHNVFDDNGYKDLLVLTLFGLTKLRREGDDAKDDQERRYEMKTVARVSSDGRRKVDNQLHVTTEHTMTLANIKRYREVFLWVVAIFDQAKPEAIYEITPDKLEPYFKLWEERLSATGPDGVVLRDHINNPKIPYTFIMKNGAKVY